ncbi:MAG: ABC transporter permease [Steroidobacteraceae bacterium]
MGFFRQLALLLGMNLRSVPQRLGLVCTTLIGVTCAVGVLIAMLAMGVGARQEAMSNVRPDRVSLLSVGALGPGQSSIPKATAVLLNDLPGIRRNARGEPIAVPQALVFMQARKQSTGTAVGFPLIGSGAGLTDYAPELHLTSGRMYRPGLRELIASNACVRQYRQFAAGDKRLIQGADWLVVGNFELGSGGGNCIVYADADTVLSAFRRDSYNEVSVMLQSRAAIAELDAAIKANPLLHVEVKTEAELAAANVQQVNGILNFVSYFVGAILALAATIGAANSLYAVVDSRRRELATLRAVGFGNAPVVASTLLEAILLAVPGALIGAALAWLFFDGRAASPFNFQFHLAVTPSLALLGIVWALCMGLIGGVMPAIRAARVPVSVALRAT